MSRANINIQLGTDQEQVFNLIDKLTTMNLIFKEPGVIAPSGTQAFPVFGNLFGVPAAVPTPIYVLVRNTGALPFEVAPTGGGGGYYVAPGLFHLLCLGNLTGNVYLTLLNPSSTDPVFYEVTVLGN